MSSYAIRGKKVNFDKVIKMVDDMVALLKKEQQDDDDKKEMCEMQLDKAEDDLKVLKTTVADLQKFHCRQQGGDCDSQTRFLLSPGAWQRLSSRLRRPWSTVRRKTKNTRGSWPTIVQH